MSGLARFSLRNRAFVGLSTVIVAIFGFVSMSSLKLELIPSLELPVMAVVTTDPGSSPEVVDQQITEPVESAVRGLAGVASTSATSSSGVSMVLVELDYGTDLGQARQDLTNRLSGPTIALPDDVNPEVLAGSVDDFPVIQLAIAGDADLAEVATRVEQDVVPLLSDLEGVREVTVSGAPTQRVEITPDLAALTGAGLDTQAITSALENNGALVPAGTVNEGERALTVQVGTSFAGVEDLAVLPLVGATQPVTLGQVADVSLAEAPATSISRTDGRDSIAVGITKTPDGNTVDISHAVHDVFDDIESAVGDGASVDVVFDQAPFIEKSVEDLTVEGALGLVFAIIVILVFLLSLRSTLVTAISIPLSLLLAFIGLYVGGYSLNILTLGALTVAIGRVVDDSIVVIENIKRHLSYGTPKVQAIITGVKEVAGAITSATLATAAVFLPIAVVGGQVGELFRPFALTVSLALLASLVVALTIIPVIAGWFLKAPTGEVDAEQVRREAEQKEREGFLQRLYVPLLHRTNAHPVITLVVAVAILIGTFALAPLMKTNFLGDSGQNTVAVTQELEPGASLERQNEAATKVEEALLEIDGVETVQTTVGQGEGLAVLAGSSDASFSVTTDPEADQTALQDDIRAAIDGLEDVGKVTLDATGGFASSLDVVVTADDPEALDEAATQVLEAVEGIDGAQDVTSNASGEQPIVSVTLNQQAAAAAGLDETSLAGIVASSLQPVPLGQVVLDGERRDAVLAMGQVPQGVEALRQTPLAPGVTLGQVATVEELQVPTTVTRLDGDRSVTVSTTPESDDLGSVTTALQSAIDDLDLPDGAEASIGGVAADQDEAFTQLGLALALAVLIVYLIMVGTFRSLIQPLILLVSVPFAATGSIGLLVATGIPLGVPSLIGMLMLIGIVVTNAIVLIDLVNQYREQGLSPTDAVEEGARHRLRPILMTSLATIGALTPMAFGITGGSAFISQPLAIVVIGGLVTSTLLTLILVPVLYLLVEKVRGRFGRRQSGSVTSAT
ncbi:efflux RND transporter permease subunit [Aeromicrobium camelliae]|uniref:Efflux RND transporter permease subunit n=1 Tax=Aeromicrobium camelliae TaxID=1538144 RepID=A0A3N6W718_9ACTN|nr:efflux RND transporter permease subunit [Aeromicrobium camelliae]RQN03310.1 efflux RND transporter permease subunit [Aeromicrobium camelliae]